MTISSIIPAITHWETLSAESADNLINYVNGSQVLPTTISKTYNMPDNYGEGVKVGIVSLGGGWLGSDLQKSLADLNLTLAQPITSVIVDNAANIFTANYPSPITNNDVYSSENTLDLYCVAGIVPSANIVIYTGQSSLTSFANVLNRAVSEECDVITMSYAFDESLGLGDFLSAPLANAAAKGITVLAASGDKGSTGNDINTTELSVCYPASSPNVIGVGGTQLTYNTSNSNYYSRISEFAANASGGGVSTLFPVPTWQAGLTANLFFSSNNYSQVSTITGRGVPDISAPYSTYVLWYGNTITGASGTSASTPIMAGMIARLKSSTKVGLSSPEYNSLLYKNTNAFYDITTGNNDSYLPKGYATTTGWDPVTGLGSPNGVALYSLLIQTLPKALSTLLGVTYNKDNSGTYKPLKGLFHKQGTNWTPVKTAWYKRSDGVWERIYPTPRGINTPTVTALTFNPYQHYQDVPAQTFRITNTGDYDLVINSATLNDSVGNYITFNFPTSLPTTIPQGGRLDLPINVYGNTTGTFTGNVAFTNYTGYLGYANTSIPVTVNVRPNYNNITLTPNPVSLSYYVLDSLATTTVTIKNSGNGDNLLVSAIASQNGYVTVSGISTPAVLGGTYSTTNFNTTFTGATTTFTLTAANLNVGTYRDTITITGNASNAPTLTVPVTVTVSQLNGLEALTSPGNYSFTVPAHVHRLNIAAFGAGGGGGVAIYNGQSYVGGSTVLQGGGGGGGGSGAYNPQTVAVTPGETLSIRVGQGGPAGVSASSQFYPVTLSYSWSSFMNSYAVWTNPDGSSPIGSYVRSTRVFSAPYAGIHDYEFEHAADDYLNLYVDNILIATTGGDSTSSTKTTVSLAGGNRVITFAALNIAGPGGFALTIKPSGTNNILWTTRTELSAWDGKSGEATTISGSFGTITVAGGAPGGGSIDDGVVPTSGDGGGGGDGVD